MPAKKNTTPRYVTKEILRKEITRIDTKIDKVTNRLDLKIDGVEKRLNTKIDNVEYRLNTKIDSKVDIAVQSMKDYSDSRFTQLDQKMDTMLKKLDMTERGIMEMLQHTYGEHIMLKEKVDEHEQRIVKLEERTAL